MNAHRRHGDICLSTSQVTSVLLRGGQQTVNFLRMAETFYDALLWHMDKHGTTVADLAHGAGVSEDAIKKIRTRPGGGTRAQTGARIAAFYGKTLEQFMACEDVGEMETLISTLRLLEPAERKLLLLQAKGILSGRSN